jgi:glycosyltransferase involved in cell wall biosynthesis
VPWRLWAFANANEQAQGERLNALATRARVSVIIAAYRSRWLREAIDSALSQTLTELEVVVAADGSDEGIPQIVDSVSDPRIHFIPAAGQTGVAETHRRAFAAASAPIFGILNDDDVWEPTFVEELLPPLEDDPSVVLSFGSHWIADAEGAIDLEGTAELERHYRREGLASGRHQPFGTLALVHLSVPLTAASLFRREPVAEGPDPRSGPAYDLHLLYLLARSGEAAYYNPRRLSRYRIHSGQATQTSHELNALGCGFAIREALSDGALLERESGLEMSLRLVLAQNEYRLGTVRLRLASRRGALPHFGRSLRLGNRRAALGLLACCAPRSVVRRVVPLQ